MNIYTIWSSESGGCYGLTPGTEPVRGVNGKFLYDDEVLLLEFQAASWEEAIKKFDEWMDNQAGEELSK